MWELRQTRSYKKLVCIIFFILIKMDNHSSGRSYRRKKERLQKRLVSCIKIVLKKIKKKHQNGCEQCKNLLEHKKKKVGWVCKKVLWNLKKFHARAFQTTYKIFLMSTRPQVCLGSKKPSRCKVCLFCKKIFSNSMIFLILSRSQICPSYKKSSPYKVLPSYIFFFRMYS